MFTITYINICVSTYKLTGHFTIFFVYCSALLADVDIDKVALKNIFKNKSSFKNIFKKVLFFLVVAISEILLQMQMTTIMLSAHVVTS